MNKYCFISFFVSIEFKNSRLEFDINEINDVYMSCVGSYLMLHLRETESEDFVFLIQCITRKCNKGSGLVLRWDFAKV